MLLKKHLTQVMADGDFQCERHSTIYKAVMKSFTVTVLFVIHHCLVSYIVGQKMRQLKHEKTTTKKKDYNTHTHMKEKRQQTNTRERQMFSHFFFSNA